MPARWFRWLPSIICLALAGCGASGTVSTPALNLPDATADMVAGTKGQLDLGRLLLQSDPAQAERLFRAVLSNSPNDPATLNDLGIALDLLGRHTDAQAAYRHALQTDPGQRAARVNLALSLALTRELSAAVQTLQPLEGETAASPAERAGMQAVSALAKVPVAELPKPAAVP
ncbi:MAG TPA: tetratricopeptide repeat protein [Acetobacteraceae bacterium]|nr:tetratricopeptide repeat protein [Acetobacteraceae bacterium]